MNWVQKNIWSDWSTSKQDNPTTLIPCCPKFETTSGMWSLSKLLMYGSDHITSRSAVFRSGLHVSSSPRHRFFWYCVITTFNTGPKIKSTVSNTQKMCGDIVPIGSITGGKINWTNLSAPDAYQQSVRRNSNAAFKWSFTRSLFFFKSSALRSHARVVS